MYKLEELWRQEAPMGAEVETSELLAALVRHKKPLRCLETGTAFGQTAQYIGKALLANGLGELQTCDIEEMDGMRRRIDGLPVTFHQKKGIDLIGEQDKGLDFVFIDSWWLPVRVEEVQAVIPKMAPGGLLCLHDINQNYGGVYREAQKTGWNSLIMLAPYGLGIFQASGFDQFIGMGKPVHPVELKK